MSQKPMCPYNHPAGSRCPACSDGGSFAPREAARESPMVARWKAEAAVATLENLGYTYSGGTLWKPPLGKPPAYLGIETGGCAPPVLATPPPGGQPRSVDGSQPKEASPMRTVKSSVNTTTHTLDPVYVQNALASHTRAGSFGPLADPNLDTIDVTLLSNGGAEIVVVNTPPATEENR